MGFLFVFYIAKFGNHFGNFVIAISGTENKNCVVCVIGSKRSELAKQTTIITVEITCEVALLMLQVLKMKIV